MKTQTVYKVIQRFNKKLFSYAGMPSEKSHYRYTIRYFVNRAIKPRKNQNPFVFCFETLEYARKFLANSSCKEWHGIYEAVGTNVKTVAKLLDGKVVESKNYRQGTVFASSLKLVKRIS